MIWKDAQRDVCIEVIEWDERVPRRFVYCFSTGGQKSLFSNCSCDLLKKMSQSISSKRAANTGSSPEDNIGAVRRRLAPEDREHQIVQKAIAFYASHGFNASTRDLAKELGVNQSLLYRYFPTKDALADRVYEEVFVRRWNPEWEEWLVDRSMPLADRLKKYLRDYARFILRSEWVRIFIFAGLTRGGINQKYLNRLRERHFKVIAREMRHAFDIPDPTTPQEEEDELELVWAMHSSVFYIGVRKWVYEQPIPKNLDRAIDLRVDAFISGTPAVLKLERQR